jgi:hypothetical protein
MTRGPVPGRLIAGVGGLLLIVSLFLPWAGADGADRTGFEVLKGLDVFLLIAGLIAIAAALTGGRYGVFRPDLSLNGAADLLGLVSTVVLVWLILFDFPSDGGRGIGIFLALVAAIAIACGVGDYDTLRGAPLFPHLDGAAMGAASVPDPKAEVGDALALDDPGRLELDVIGAEVVEEPPPLAE